MSGEARQTRFDALPEYTAFRDSGCEYAPSCLHCPLPFCRYDEPKGVGTAAWAARAQRDAEMAVLIEQGVRHGEIARRFGVCRRTVVRIAGERTKGGGSTAERR